MSIRWETNTLNKKKFGPLTGDKAWEWHPDPYAICHDLKSS